MADLAHERRRALAGLFFEHYFVAPQGEIRGMLADADFMSKAADRPGFRTLDERLDAYGMELSMRLRDRLADVE